MLGWVKDKGVILVAPWLFHCGAHNDHCGAVKDEVEVVVVIKGEL